MERSKDEIIRDLIRENIEATMQAELKALRAENDRTRVAKAARDALVAAGARQVELLTPHVAGQLKAIHDEADNSTRVLAVDSNGQVRAGRRGHMTADELVAEMRRTHAAWPW
jgi:hypothetical protein